MDEKCHLESRAELGFPIELPVLDELGPEMHRAVAEERTTVPINMLFASLQTRAVAGEL